MLESSPDWKEIKGGELSRLILAEKELEEVLKKANDIEYLYWDKFKYCKIPNSFSLKECWAYIKMIRTMHSKNLIVKDIKNKKFSYWMPEHVLKGLHSIDFLAGGNIGIDDSQVLDKERYLVNSIMDEAINSSLLEGAVSTHRVAKQMLISGKKPKDRSQKMILNNYLTIKKIKDYVDKPLSSELIKSLHESITKNTLEKEEYAGKFREWAIYIKDKQGQILFNPPSHKEIATRIEELCKFANNESSDFMHPVIKAILLHFFLAYIHPFDDGNGRTARALFYWYMLKCKYWLFEYLSISTVILNKAGQYKKAYLYTEEDASDTTYFISFHIKAIIESIKLLQNKIKKDMSRLVESKKILEKYPGLNMRQNGLIYHAIYHPGAIYDINSYKTINKVTYETARTDILDLVKKGFLSKEMIGKRKACFVLDDKLFNKLRAEL